MSSLRDAKRVHVVGVGGAGMSAVAQLLKERGADVSGSDLQDSPRLGELRQRGVHVVVGHDPALAALAEVVLWSPAVGENDPELRGARQSGAALLTRAQLFAQLTELGEVVGICGTHGKTTATSMMIHVARAARRDVGWLVGAEVLGVGANGHWGDEGLVVEVDESYGTFALLRPRALGLLNVEPDHLDHYVTVGALEASFAQLVGRTTGPVVVWRDDAGAARVASTRADVVTVGTRGSSWLVRDVELTRLGSTFTLVGPGETLGIRLAVTGFHNVANAAVVAVLARTWGLSASAVVEGLANFAGAPRRFQLRGRWRAADVIEDYAHLPGEIAATLRATRAIGYERPLVIFQPHRVTRTLALVEAFADAFEGAAELIITDLYTAGEANPSGVSGAIVAEAVHRAHPTAKVAYAGALNNVVDVANGLAMEFDVVLVLGAGDVSTIIEPMVAQLVNLDALRELDAALVDFDAPLGPRTTYRVGGAVRALVTLRRRADVDAVGRALVASAAPIVAVGKGSILVNEGVHDVVGVALEGEFAGLRWRDELDHVVVTLGAGVALPVAARRLASEGVIGFEWAVGVPGTFGGAVAMNAGGHGSDVARSLSSAAVWRAGVVRTFGVEELALGYRCSALGVGDVVLEGQIRLERGDAAAASERVREIVRWRREHQPGGANAGSVFSNPPDDFAARLIERAGAKGLRHASAAVSDKHANFIQADAGGRARDVFELMNIVAQMVLEKTGVVLERENRLLGFGSEP